jgi:hypothetical protein
VADQNPPRFSMDNPYEWGQIEGAFELAPWISGPPVAVQVFDKVGASVVNVGILAGTEDHDDNKGKTLRSIFYFKDTEGVVIDWANVRGATAMVADTYEDHEKRTGDDRDGTSASGEGATETR